MAAWADFLPPSVRTDLTLAVSEVVTNAVRHGPDGARIRVSARRCEEGLRVEVRDEGLPQTIGVRAPYARGGRGLRIVEAVAARWGVSSDPTLVWFTIADPGGSRARAGA
jgi:anti-sigma regulatory factor (Ser/Thr protein kinase)